MGAWGRSPGQNQLDPSCEAGGSGAGLRPAAEHREPKARIATAGGRSPGKTDALGQSADVGEGQADELFVAGAEFCRDRGRYHFVGA